MADVYRLWDFSCGEEEPVLTHYIPKEYKSDWTVLICSGGGYGMRAEHEGRGYAEFLNKHGINAFVVDYRVAPCRFPEPLADARRAIRLMRYHAEEWQVNKDKIAIMGSSAGGHLAALVSNYHEIIAGESNDAIDREDYMPNAQILCYPVINLMADFGHVGSGQNLLGEAYDKWAQKLSVETLVTEKTPPAFIWHTATDPVVPVMNSLIYTKRLLENGVGAELHIFPKGLHGQGLADHDPNDPVLCHMSQWSGLLLKWIDSL